MNINGPSTSKHLNIDFDDVEIFEDSTVLANFENSDFKDSTAGFQENIINDSLNKTDLNISALCCDEEISGYDKLTGKTWIYPTNYPVRDYQFNIIQAAILKNTLVSLPTGLGKTFIAAVIMYNFYRWYPLGKIIFTAPTRPLVAQQIEACYNIIGIPPDDTIEMTGHMQVNTRKQHWQQKRVFFATPQVIYNDIKSDICPGNKIRCLVIDEAHRARGNYAYCQIMGSLADAGCRTFRVLALSATPGSKVEDVVNVIKNLHIAHLELRTEACIDVAKYSHSRKINTVLIQLGPELTRLRQQYVEILDGYARRLKQLNILPHNVGNLSKGRIVILYKEYQNKERGARHPQHNYIMKDFTMLIALYHGLELLVKHGSRVFLNFFDEHPEKSWIQADDKLTMLLERLRDDLGVNPLSLDRSILPDGTLPELPENLCFGHPKFYRLKEIMLEHFKLAQQKGQDTKAIVFCEYRESVNLVHCLLLQCRPLIKPQMFVGQGASGKDGKTVVSQKQQARVMRSFRSGACNALVATCVAEEGLDVGSVDLILCFDISTRSPIRLVQRCGRTGRERGGQVFILVTEGREHQTLLDSMRQRDSLNNRILHSKEVEKSLYKMNPRMMPHDFKPVCQKMFITVAKKTNPKEKKQSIETAKKGQKDLRSMLFGRKSTSGALKEFDTVNLISEVEFNELYPEGYKNMNFFDEPKEYWTMSKEQIMSLSRNEEQSKSKLATWLEWQRTLQNTVNIGHSSDTEIMTAILQYGDAKRFDMPASSQNPCFNTQIEANQSQKAVISSPAKLTKQTKKSRKLPSTKSPVKKDGDIRALFSTATKSTKNYTKLINDLGIQNNGNIPMKIIDLLVDLNLDNATTKPCYICQTICDCKLMQTVKQPHNKPGLVFTFLNNLKLPDVDLINGIDAESILKCAKTEDSKDTDMLHEKDGIYVNKHNCSNNFDLDFDFDSPIEDKTSLKESETFTENNAAITNFDVGDIEDIFAVDSPVEEAKEIIEVENKDTSDPKEALGFFGLESIDDIFADSDDSVKETTPTVTTPKKNNKSPKISNTAPIAIEYPVSPSILSGRVLNAIDTSPILVCSQVRKPKHSTTKHQVHNSTTISSAKRQLIKDDTQNIKHDLSKSSIRSSFTNTSNNKSMFTITQLVEMINKNDDSVLKKSQNVAKEDNVKLDLERSPSPILLTQAEKLKSFSKTPSHNKTKNPASIHRSLIILDSDSDSDEHTQIYDISDKVNNISKTEKDASPVSNKRKFNDVEEETTASPYFNKKPKLCEVSSKASLQQKVLAALSSNKMCDDNDTSKDLNLNFMYSLTQNENKIHRLTNGLNDKENKLEQLQMFRRDIKANGFANKKDKFKNTGTQNRKLMFNDSDDDFVDDKPKSQKNTNCSSKQIATANHKVRKKNMKNNSFLDLEAALSNSDGSEDELSDDSVGSIIDFICDENVTQSADVQAMYLRSVKSPVKGVFKIPELPKKRTNVLSQFVEEDSYEMDSFCVDSHIGLTQVNDISELELAEIVLEQERKAKKSKFQSNSLADNDGSPLVRNKKKARRQIQSDSDDSS